MSPFAASTSSGETGSCPVCGKPRSEKPMVFRNDPWCSDDHRKVIQGEITPTDKEWGSMTPELLKQLGGRRCP